MADLHHECGIVAVYHLPGKELSPRLPQIPHDQLPAELRENRTDAELRRLMTSRLIPRLLLDIQNRGQLAAGLTTWDPNRSSLLQTYKDVGSVSEVFRLNRKEEYERLIASHPGEAAIGHVRYATCGKDGVNYAQPFERPHIERRKWFSFAFNGNLANFAELKKEITSKPDFVLQRDIDTEVIMHVISQTMMGELRPSPVQILRTISQRFDGAYNIVYLNAAGDMIVARDPLGLRPLCYAIDGPLFAAASESIALANMGFDDSQIKNVTPGTAVIIQDGQIRIERFAETPATGPAHCFFEWIYFANVASTLDNRSVYLARKRLGEALAEIEDLSQKGNDLIVVPVPDTAKAAADAMAYRLGIPCLEGLIRNRYVGRTFIEGRDQRRDKARTKYTPLREVLEGKRILLVEDTIVRSTTMRALISQLKERGGAAEVHVRVACPPIVAPCFYGIDMSTVKELFAASYLNNGPLTPEIEATMARELGATSLRYLPVEALAKCVDLPRQKLCQACVDGHYPTPTGQQLYQLALSDFEDPNRCDSLRTTERVVAVAT